MSDGMTDGAGQRVVELPAVLDMVGAAELKQDLDMALAAGRAVRIEADDVQRVTTPGLQVLAAAARSFVEGGLAFSLGVCAPPLVQGAELLGLGPVLGLHGEDNG